MTGLNSHVTSVRFDVAPQTRVLTFLPIAFRVDFFPWLSEVLIIMKRRLSFFRERKSLKVRKLGPDISYPHIQMM
jgi:hypothetical protein